MDACRRRSPLLHFAVCICDLRPFLAPIVLDQAARFVVIVVEAPRREGPAGVRESEALPVRRDAKTLHRRSLGTGRGAPGQKEKDRKPHARAFWITFPATSVSRWARPWWRYVSFV